ncbi:MAG: hypothetical protein D4R64_06210 [Porphyromonadaceae bacterium]|nr:MAG: hypothetical protein D4R64_06210 [Porphyromonadaceae bacterium]
MLNGDAIGEKFYSDGKRIALRFPDFPDLTKCYQCGKYFWLDTAERHVKTVGQNRIDTFTPERIEEVRFLTIDEYFEALSIMIPKKKSMEKFIRLKIWWAYNDTVRDIESVYASFWNDERWKSNLEIFIGLLDPFDINELIMMAEMNRNLGDFSKCLEILNYIEDDQVTWLKKRFVAECNKQNSIVFEVEKNIII